MVGRYLPKYILYTTLTTNLQEDVWTFVRYYYSTSMHYSLLGWYYIIYMYIYIIYIHVPCCDGLNNSHVPLFSLRGREIPRTCLQRLHHIVHIAGWFVWDLIAKEKKEKNHVEVASLRQSLHVHVRCSID